MKLGVMQPYFFPYLGYFDLINSVDHWIVADSVQYIRHGWINRNRIHHSQSDWKYIIAPVRKCPLGTPIHKIKTVNSEWRMSILRSLHHYKKHAPFFKRTYELVEECLETKETSLAPLNVSILARTCSYLEIPFKWEYLSELDLPMDAANSPEELAILISRTAGATEYINPPGGADLYNPEKFKQHGIDLRIKNIIDFQYNCSPYEFIPYLSIIDVLMWNTPHTIRKYLDSVRDKIPS